MFRYCPGVAKNVTAILLGISLLVFSSISIVLSEPALASSCTVKISQPVLRATHSVVAPATVGQDLVLAVTATNCTSQEIPFVVVIEVRDSAGVTEKIGWQSGVLDPNGRTDIGVLWTPEHGDNYEVRSFAITDFEMPNILTPVSASNQEIVERNTEMLELEFYVTKSELSTQETYGTSYYLVNNGRHPVALTVDDYIGLYESSNGATTRRFGPDSLCTWKNAFEIEQPDIILEPRARMNLTDMSSLAEAPKYPGIYTYSPFVILSVQGQNRVKCMEIVANEGILNVTGAAPYGVNLVLHSDKERYKKDEVVYFSVFIENTSNDTFTFTEDVGSISISDQNGSRIMGWEGSGSDFELITIAPHSQYQVSDLFRPVWNLTNIFDIPPDSDEIENQASPRVYFIDASFANPHLKAKTLEISVVK